MERLNDIVVRHRFLALIGLVVVVAAVMTSVSMTLYVTSGASSLDLSRPNYVQARSQVKEDTVSKDFPATGPLGKSEYELYKTLFDKQHKTINELGSYEQAPIDDSSLRLSDQEQPTQ